MSGVLVRANAVEVLATVIDRQVKLKDAFRQNLKVFPNTSDRAFVKALCFGVLRWLPRLEFIVVRLVTRPSSKKDCLIKYLIYLGIYQIEYLDIPNHAAVFETVAACRLLNRRWSDRLVNAVLRRYLREREQISLWVEQDLEAYYAHPLWLIEQIKADYPNDYGSILHANNQHADMYLRVNLKYISREVYQRRLSDVGIVSEKVAESISALRLQTALPAEQLPGFEEGWVALQDLAAQLAADILVLPSNARVLDACAAPGGKTALFMERYPDIGELVAVDKSAKRIEKLEQSLLRLGHQAKVVHADTIEYEKWWDGKAFDGVILDVPCSGTGVIRRQPDMKILNTTERIEALLICQSQLLVSCWKLLRRGGRLLYSSCSVLAWENVEQIKKFMQTQKDCALIRQSLTGLTDSPYGLQIRSGSAGRDGFFYALLEKQ